MTEYDRRTVPGEIVGHTGAVPLNMVHWPSVPDSSGAAGLNGMEPEGNRMGVRNPLFRCAIALALAGVWGCAAHPKGPPPGEPGTTTLVVANRVEAPYVLERIVVTV